MGGNATGGIRLPAEAYRRVEADVMARLRAVPMLGKAASTIPVAAKRDFGDLDIVYEALPEGPSVLIEALTPISIAPKAHPERDPTVSLAIATPDGPFQVDLISVPPGTFDFAHRYFSLNDLGNLIGRVARRRGFKHGHVGLQYNFRDPNNERRTIALLDVTRDWGDALEFLGYDPIVYERGLAGGIRTLEDMYTYAASSRFFAPEIFDLTNRNHTARTRERKRPSYMGFLAWIERTKPVWRPIPSAEEGLTAAFERWPDFAVAYAAAEATDQLRQRRAVNFNGDTVASATGFAGSELGAAMKRIRESFESVEAFEDWALVATADDIRERSAAALENAAAESPSL
jgi:hypothetical protein